MPAALRRANTIRYPVTCSSVLLPLPRSYLTSSVDRPYYMYMNETTTKLPVFKTLFAAAAPEPRRRYPRNTASLTVTTKLPVCS